MASKLEIIQRGIRLLFKPGQLVELRARTADTGWRGFYFTDHERLADVVKKLDDDYRVVALYYVINPCKPNLIKTRETCTCGPCKGGGLVVDNPTDSQVEQILNGPRQHLTSNDEVDTLVWMFTDVDTTRAKGFEHESSTNEEKAAAMNVARSVLSHLTEKGWPQPLLADSGNGFHLLYRVNLTNTAHNVNQLVDVLKALKAQFSNDAAEIDASVHNPARLTRAYGSTTRKGTNTAERPYRQNSLKEPQVPVTQVTLDNLLTMITESPTAGHRSDDMPELDPAFDPQDWITWYKDQGAFRIEGDKEWQGKPILATDICLYAGRKHSGDDFKAGFIIGDTFGYKCFSDECAEKTIKEIYKWLREAEDDQGNPLYSPYPFPIYKTDTLEELFDALSVEILDEVEQEEAQAQEAEVSNDLAPDPEPDVETPQPAARVPDDLDKHCDKLAHNMLRVMLNHPEEVYLDGFQHYVRRFREKLGVYNDNPTKKRHKEEKGEVTEVTLTMPVGETLITIIKYVDTHRSLPDKDALKNFISINDGLKNNKFKAEMVKYITEITEKPASTFDETAEQLLRVLDIRFELKSVRAALPILKEGDIQGFRSALRRNQNKSTVQDSNFSSGTWQEKTDEIYDRFARKLHGVDNARKFKTGFWTLDNSGMNIGLDGNRAICFCGPSNNRKTTAVMSLTLNFAIQGKNGIFFAGEHHHTKVLDKLTLQLSHFYKEDPEIGPIPGLGKWESLNVTATEENLESIKKLLFKLKAGEIVPGYVEVQNVDVIAGGEENKIDALLDYAESTFNKYQWDFIIIDPIDTCMPNESSVKGNTFQLKADEIKKLFNFSRNAFGGKGCMVIITAQFGSAAVRDIQKIQEKNQGAERFDDEIEAILRRDGNIHSLTTIVEKFDLCIGVATLQKNGEEGLMVAGRNREAGKDWTMHFHVDPESNYMTENRKPYSKISPEQAKAATAAVSETMGNVDEL